MTTPPHEDAAEAVRRLARERGLTVDDALVAAVAAAVTRARPSSEAMRRRPLPISPFAVGPATPDRWLEDYPGPAT